MSWAYLDFKPSKDAIARAVSLAVAIPFEEIEVRDVFDNQNLDKTKLLVTQGRRIHKGRRCDGPFAHRVTAGAKYRECKPDGEYMSASEFGPKLAIALGAPVIFVDESDESDSARLPLCLAFPDGAVRQIEFKDEEVVFVD